MATDWDTFQATRYFASLDGLRCLAITAVIWHHTSFGGAHVVPLMERGYLGADFFLLLTGFLITTGLLRERRKCGVVTLRDFYARRLLRIVPLYYSVLALYVALVVAVERDSSEGRAFIHNLPYFLTFTSNWGVRLDGRVIFYFAWTVAAIVQFYVVWAPLEKYLKSGGAIVAAVGVIAVVEAVRWKLFGETLRHFAALGSFEITCFGALLAYVLDWPGGYRMARKWIGWRWSSVAALVLLLGTLCLKPGTPPLPMHCAMVLLVGCCAVREDHALAPVLRWPLMRHLGAVSYGMYLLHMLAFNVVRRVFDPLSLQGPAWYFAGTFVGAAVVATLSFRYYESWFLRLKPRFCS